MYSRHQSRAKSDVNMFLNYTAHHPHNVEYTFVHQKVYRLFSSFLTDVCSCMKKKRLLEHFTRRHAGYEFVRAALAKILLKRKKLQTDSYKKSISAQLFVVVGKKTLFFEKLNLLRAFFTPFFSFNIASHPSC